MNRATRAAAVGLGIYAGLLAIVHGIFEILQGNTAIDPMIIQAMGSSCQPDAVWHACLPALTLVPNFLVSGIVTVFLGAALVVWSLARAALKFGGIGMMLLSLGLLLLGGGFVPAYMGLLGGIAATQIRRDARGGAAGLARFLGRLWPTILLVLLAWFPLSWLLGWLLPQVMLNLRLPFFILFDLLLPLLTALSGIFYDRVRKRSPLQKQ